MNDVLNNMLIIDDEGLMAISLEEIFTEASHTNVITASNGEEGIELCKTTKFQIIITDFQMPIMDGGELIKELRLNSGLNKNTPIIILTGKRKTEVQEFLDYDKVYYHIKPMRIGTMAQLIMEALK